MSTFLCFARQAFLIRVSMSAFGSVIDIRLSPSAYESHSVPKLYQRRWPTSLPARLRGPGNLPCQSQLTETDATYPKAPHKAPRAPAPVAAIVLPDLELRSSIRLHNQCFLGHTRLLIYWGLNGTPSPFSNSYPSSSVFAVVTSVISIPRILSILSKSISGNMICS